MSLGNLEHDDAVSFCDHLGVGRRTGDGPFVRRVAAARAGLRCPTQLVSALCVVHPTRTTTLWLPRWSSLAGRLDGHVRHQVTGLSSLSLHYARAGVHVEEAATTYGFSRRLCRLVCFGLSKYRQVSRWKLLMQILMTRQWNVSSATFAGRSGARGLRLRSLFLRMQQMSHRTSRKWTMLPLELLLPTCWAWQLFLKMVLCSEHREAEQQLQYTASVQRCVFA